MPMRTVRCGAVKPASARSGASRLRRVWWEVVCGVLRGAVPILIAWSVLAAQEPCGRCAGAGLVPCPRCASERDGVVLRCSVAAGCTTCRGAVDVECGDCSTAGSAAVSRLATRRTVVAQWLVARRTALASAAGGKIRRVAGVLHCSTEHFDLIFAPARIASCPTSDPHRQLHLFAARLEAARARFVKVLGLQPADFRSVSATTTVAPRAGSGRSDDGRLAVFVLADPRDFRRVCAGVTGLVPQGIGTRSHDGAPRYAVLHDPGVLRDDAALHRNLVHNVTHLLLANIQPATCLGERGHGWLDAGLAHYFESLAADRPGTVTPRGGVSDSFCFQQHAQRPLTFDTGDWLAAARNLAAAGRLPAIARLIGQDTSDLDLEEHLAGTAFVAFLIETRGALAPLVRLLARGVGADEAVRKVWQVELRELIARFETWLPEGRGNAVGVATTGAERHAGRKPHHAALFVYTRGFVRPRHVAVVEKALRQRAAAHTSGFGLRRGKPVLALGPVSGTVRHFKGERITNTVWAAWPFVAVVEFALDGDPKATIDWLRRKRHSRDPGAWFLDPAGTYVEHINAEVVCHRDARYGYMAVVDTPTGDVIATNEFCIRARVDWAADTSGARGRTSRLGWWVRFDTSRSVEPRDWVEILEPLVDWRTARKAARGVLEVEPVGDPQRELAVWGSGSVQRFPVIPAGMRPCGR